MQHHWTWSNLQHLLEHFPRPGRNSSSPGAFSGSCETSCSGVRRSAGREEGRATRGKPTTRLSVVKDPVSFEVPWFFRTEVPETQSCRRQPVARLAQQLELDEAPILLRDVYPARVSPSCCPGSVPASPADEGAFHAAGPSTPQLRVLDYLDPGKPAWRSQGKSCFLHSLDWRLDGAGFGGMLAPRLGIQRSPISV
ncbi:hypothetical protein KM043_015303 [Ampulex compressa]|nr:hypothetical protein KM043_015303 [Ampulex compressa]